MYMFMKRFYFYIFMHRISTTALLSTHVHWVTPTCLIPHVTCICHESSYVFREFSKDPIFVASVITKTLYKTNIRVKKIIGPSDHRVQMSISDKIELSFKINSHLLI